MRIKSILLVVAILAFASQSCDEFLEETLISDVAAATYYTTPSGLDDAVDATYSWLKFIHSNERAYTLTVFGTDEYSNGADGGFKSFNYYDNGLNSSISVLREIWEECYQGINQANAVLNRSADIPGMDPTILARRQAEVRFLRAYYYFILVQQWGNVHLTLEETVGAKVEANKTPASQIYEEAIVPDLEFAIATLPNTQSEYGRITKAAAEFMLGKVLTTRGWKSYAKFDDFTRAEALFTSVVTGYGFSLQTTMDRVWNQDNQRNSEIIWAVQYSTNAILNGGEGNRGHLYFLMEYDVIPGMIRTIADGRPFKRFRPTDYLLNLYGANRDNDNRYDLTYRHVWISNNATTIPKWSAAEAAAGYGVAGQPKFTVGDTAVFIPGPGRETKWMANGGDLKKRSRYRVYTRNAAYAGDPYTFSERVFPHFLKFMDPRRPTIQWEQGSRDWFVARLSDAYLLRAEVRFKLNNTAGAAADINVVRTRAAKAGRVAQMQITGADVTLDRILEERSLELDGEQTRWYDLVRTGKLVERTKLHNPQATGIQDYHTVRPIPQTQIDRTLGGYPQNCGYPGGVCD